MASNTDWLLKSKWGVFTHYLGAAPSTPGGAELTADEWNRWVDEFDVQGLVSQLVSTGCGYYCMTLGQNSGHYLAPNPTYDSLVGIRPSKCSKRDLVADIYDALSPHGVKLMAYLPSGAPAADPVAMSRLGWEWGFEGSWPQAWETKRTGRRLADFQRKWEAVICDWSLRWGRKVAGWWIDGCYFADEMYRFPDEPNFASFAAALKAGNPDAIVAFNPGVKVPVICHSEDEDFTAGEISEAFPTCPGRWVERNGHQAQYHILSYLGDTWCGGAKPRFPDPFVIGYTKYLNGKGGVITWDVPIARCGLIPDVFVAQLAAIGRAMVSR